MLALNFILLFLFIGKCINEVKGVSGFLIYLLIILFLFVFL